MPATPTELDLTPQQRRGLEIATITVLVAGLLAAVVVFITRPSPAERIADAAAKARDAERFGYELSIHAGPPGAGAQVTIVGQADLEKGLSEAQRGGPMLASAQVIVGPQSAYVAVPEASRHLTEGRPWLAVPRADISGRSAGTAADLTGTPLQLFDDLGAIESAEELGREEVRGVGTTHYQARLSSFAFADRVRTQLGGAAQVSPRGEEVEVWLDGDGRPRRLSAPLELTTPALGNAVVRATVIAEIFDYGEEVDVEIPAEDQTFRGSGDTAREILGAP